MKLLRLFIIFNFCLLSYVGSIHALEHGVDFDHQVDCTKCIALSVTSDWYSPDELTIENTFSIEETLVSSLKLVFIQSSQKDLPLSRGPPSNLI